jgi:anti-sigma regulatory factor (Ser/Thr protein kinase)
MNSTDPAADSAVRQSAVRQPGEPPASLLDQPFGLDGLYSLRAAVAAHAARLGASPTVIDQLVIVVSELASNAIRHGGGAGRLRLSGDPDRIHLEISDHGPGMTDPTRGIDRPEPTATGGRGLWICRQLTPHLDITTGPRGTTITAVIALGGHNPGV